MDIKIVSINTWCGGKLWENLLDFLRQQDADIVLLQEVYNHTKPELPKQFRTFSVLKDELGYEYGDFASAFLENTSSGKILQGNAVLSKFRLTGHEPIFFNEPFNDDYYELVQNFPTCPRNLQHSEVTTPQGTVHIFNFQGVWDLDGDNDSPRRRNMSRIILEQTKGLQRVVVAGDTNAKPTNPAMLAIEKQLVSVFKNDLPTSFNIRRKDLKKFPGYATATVDLMYVSPDVKIIARDCPNVDISDHLPLTATLRIS